MKLFTMAAIEVPTWDFNVPTHGVLILGGGLNGRLFLADQPPGAARWAEWETRWVSCAGGYPACAVARWRRDPLAERDLAEVANE